jgi:hypothetical protein
MTTIKIKNSSVLNKVPTRDDLVTAELALNLANKVLYTKDDNGDVFKIAGSTQSGATANRPAAPNPGEIFYDTTEEDFYYYDGTSWHALTEESGHVIVSDTPPTIEDEGELWYDIKGGGLFVSVDNADGVKIWAQSL